MSRMDILTPQEINTLLNKSELVKKYNDTIDRESAYEILNKKIEEAEALKQKMEAKEEAAKAKEREEKSNSRRSTTRRSTAMNPIVKVLTSATFIRAVFGILKKAMK